MSNNLLSLLRKPQNPISVAYNSLKSIGILGFFSEKDLSEGTHLFER